MQTCFNNLSCSNVFFLQRCEITFLSNDIFKELNYLQDLRLVNNPITRLEPTAFTSLKNLKYLWLDQNQATYNNGQLVTHHEFSNLLRDLINKEIYVSFTNHLGYDSTNQ